MRRSNQLIALAMLSTLTIGSAFAADSKEENEAMAIANAKISLSQAITAAEQHVGGKASKAEFGSENGQNLFEVEVVKGNTVTDVKVDPSSGAVTSADNDQKDHDGDEEDENG